MQSGDSDDMWDPSQSLSVLVETVARVHHDWEAIQTFPEVLLHRCWEDVQENGPSAATALCLLRVLSRRAKAANEDSAFLDLKRLFELCLRQQHSLAGDCIDAIYPRARQFLNQRKALKRVSDADKDPMQVIDEVLFGDASDKIAHLNAGLLLSCYRFAALNAHMLPPDASSFMASLYAIREAYAYYIGGATEAARASLVWASDLIDAISPDSAPEQSAGIGICLKATACAAGIANERGDELDLLRRALQFLPLEGDERADALLSIAIAYEKLGQFAEAIESYNAVLAVAEVEDKEVLDMARTGRTILRAEFEADPKKFVGIPHASLNDSFGFDGTGWGEFLEAIGPKMAAGEKLSDEEGIQGLQEGLAFVRSLAKVGQPESAFRNAILPMRIGMSVSDPAKFPSKLLCELIRLADELSSLGSPQEVAEYSRLKAMVEQHPSVVELREGENLRRALANLRRPFENPEASEP